MQIYKYFEFVNIDVAIQKGEPMLAVISFDGKQVYMGHIDECVEHHILLTKAGLSSMDIDKYFRIIFDLDGADWTFICPPSYKGITDRTRRISAFYRDGFAVISEFLANIGLLVDIKIPRRYRRHIDALADE